MTTSSLRRLANLILESLDEIDHVMANSSRELPSLDTPIASPAELQAYKMIKGPATTIRACCGQIAASIAPVSTLADTARGHMVSSCLKVVGTINAAEVLREAGPKGLHVRELCQHSDTDPQKMARILRLLASHHIFREIEPDVFTNNRLSSLLDSGCSVYDLYRPDGKRHDKFLAPRGAAAALMELTVDDGPVIAAKLTDCLTGSTTAHSAEPTHAPVNLAFETQLPVMEWQQISGNEFRRIRFDVAMSASREGPLRGFNWQIMQPGSKIVDVGGGHGTLFLDLAEEQKHLNFIVQDQPTVLIGAKDFWQRNRPETLTSGRIQFQAIDFFKPQPLTDATLFILRHVIHDWSDKYAVQILRNLRTAAQSSTRLVIIDIEVPFACANAPGAEADIPREGFPAWISAAPAPLLPNYGMGRLEPYFFDILMLMWNNGQERTLPALQQLLRDAGWAIDTVHYIPESGNVQIVGRPIER